MGILFRPDGMLADIGDLDVDALGERGVRILFSDLDNTLTRWNDDAVPTGVLALADRLRGAGIDLVLVSNNRSERVIPFADALGAQFIARAKKPLPFSLRKYIKQREIPAGHCLLVGDQLLTDVLAGNLAGMRTCLVRPIDRSHEFLGTKINRKLEAVLFLLMGLRWEEYT